ncbi:hypothetical protein HK101_007482 [Irineochytrium annulatum]|nr:hypothetical protein HK101_007482 [Irineochytrium annulatum]
MTTQAVNAVMWIFIPYFNLSNHIGVTCSVQIVFALTMSSFSSYLMTANKSKSLAFNIRSSVMSTIFAFLLIVTEVLTLSSLIYLANSNNVAGGGINWTIVPITFGYPVLKFVFVVMAKAFTVVWKTPQPKTRYEEVTANSVKVIMTGSIESMMAIVTHLIILRTPGLTNYYVSAAASLGSNMLARLAFLALFYRTRKAKLAKIVDEETATTQEMNKRKTDAQEESAKPIVASSDSNTTISVGNKDDNEKSNTLSDATAPPQTPGVHTALSNPDFEDLPTFSSLPPSSQRAPSHDFKRPSQSSLSSHLLHATAASTSSISRPPSTAPTGHKALKTLNHLLHVDADGPAAIDLFPNAEGENKAMGAFGNRSRANSNNNGSGAWSSGSLGFMGRSKAGRASRASPPTGTRTSLAGRASGTSLSTATMASLAGREGETATKLVGGGEGKALACDVLAVGQKASQGVLAVADSPSVVEGVTVAVKKLSDGEAEVDDGATISTAIFTPMTDEENFCYNIVATLISAWSARGTSFMIMLCLNSLPHASGWSSYYGTIDPRELVLDRFLLMIPFALAVELVTVAVEKGVVGFDYIKGLRTFWEGFTWTAVFYMTMAEVYPAGLMMIADTGMFYPGRSSSYEAGRKQWI